MLTIVNIGARSRQMKGDGLTPRGKRSTPYLVVPEDHGHHLTHLRVRQHCDELEHRGPTEYLQVDAVCGATDEVVPEVL